MANADQACAVAVEAARARNEAWLDKAMERIAGVAHRCVKAGDGGARLEAAGEPAVVLKGPSSKWAARRCRAARTA